MPTWMDSLVQPIAIVDVLEAMVGALYCTGPSRHFDAGGPDQLRYGALLDAYTTYAGLERPQVDVPRPTVGALVESLRHDMVAADDDFREQLLPAEHRLVGLDEGFSRSLASSTTRPMDADPMGPLPQDPAWASGGDDRPALARAVDAVKDVLPDS